MAAGPGEEVGRGARTRRTPPQSAARARDLLRQLVVRARHRPDERGPWTEREPVELALGPAGHDREATQHVDPLGTGSVRRVEDRARPRDRLDAGAGHLRRRSRERVDRADLTPDDREQTNRCDERALQVRVRPGEAGAGRSQERERTAAEDVVG